MTFMDDNEGLISNRLLVNKVVTLYFINKTISIKKNKKN